MTEYHILIACSGFLTGSTLVSETENIARIINRSTESHTGPIVIHIIDMSERFEDMGDREIMIPFHFKITPSTYDEATLFNVLVEQLRTKLDDRQRLAGLTQHIRGLIDNDPTKINKDHFLDQLTKKDATQIRTTFGPDGMLLRYLELNNAILFDLVIFASCDDPEFLFGLLTPNREDDTAIPTENFTDIKLFDRMMDERFTHHLRDGAYFLEIHQNNFVHFDGIHILPYKKTRRDPFIKYIESRFTKVYDNEDHYYQKNPSHGSQGGGSYKYDKYKHAYNLLMSRS